MAVASIVLDLSLENDFNFSYHHYEVFSFCVYGQGLCVCVQQALSELWWTG